MTEGSGDGVGQVEIFIEMDVVLLEMSLSPNLEIEAPYKGAGYQSICHDDPNSKMGALLWNQVYRVTSLVIHPDLLA